MPGNDHTHHARCGIFGRSPRALPVIGGRGSLARPVSITNVCSSEYHGPLTSGAGASLAVVAHVIADSMLEPLGAPLIIVLLTGVARKPRRLASFDIPPIAFGCQW